MGVQFKLSVGQTILAILFAFIFSFIGAESYGRTNIIPVTSIGTILMRGTLGVRHVLTLLPIAL